MDVFIVTSDEPDKTAGAKADLTPSLQLCQLVTPYAAIIQSIDFLACCMRISADSILNFFFIF